MDEEQKQISLTIRGREKDYRLCRSIGPKTSLPVTFKVGIDRCEVQLTQGEVELVLRPEAPHFQPKESRVKLHRLKNEASVRLNGRLGTVDFQCQDSDKDSLRFVVKLDDGESVKVRPSNMLLVN
eukprot:g9017.t1